MRARLRASEPSRLAAGTVVLCGKSRRTAHARERGESRSDGSTHLDVHRATDSDLGAFWQGKPSTRPLTRSSLVTG